MKSTRVRHFYDPLYEVLIFHDPPHSIDIRQTFIANGRLDLRKSISRFLDCPELNRLHWLNQAGVIHLGFPSGTHTRYAHTLGTLHLGYIALQAVNVLKGKDKSENLLKALQRKKWVEEFLVALFLHDLGHLPFSHTLEKNITLARCLNVNRISHEEIACQLILGKGQYFEAYAQRYKNKCNNQKLVYETFQNLGNASFEKNIICYLISSDKEYLGDGFEDTSGLVEIAHNLISGQYDLDRIDHYRRDSFFTGMGHSFKPYVLLHGLSYIASDSTMRPKMTPSARSQNSNLQFIRRQLVNYCFNDLRNLSYSSMLNRAVTEHLLSFSSKKRRMSEAQIIITMGDGELLGTLNTSKSQSCREIACRIYTGYPIPAVSFFNRESFDHDTEQILEKIHGQDYQQNKELYLGFTKDFDKPNREFWDMDDSPPSSPEKCYIFSELAHEKVRKIMGKHGVDDLRKITGDEKELFSS